MIYITEMRDDRNSTSYTMAAILVAAALSSPYINSREHVPVRAEVVNDDVYLTTKSGNVLEYDCDQGGLESCVLDEPIELPNPEIAKKVIVSNNQITVPTAINTYSLTQNSQGWYRNENF